MHWPITAEVMSSNPGRDGDWFFCAGVLCFFLNTVKGDLSGKLGFDEFKVLWADLRRWKVMVFSKYKYLVFVCVSQNSFQT